MGSNPMRVTAERASGSLFLFPISNEHDTDMQIIIADAKVMRDEVNGVSAPFTSTPEFLNEASDIAREMAKMDEEEIRKSFHCSRAIANENMQRFRSFDISPLVPAVLAFYGHAYKYLKAECFSGDDFRFAQTHLSIMSFMYGLLRPLDLIHLYRMPANMKLDYTRGMTLQKWWRNKVTDALIDRVKADDGILVDLSTTEFELMCDWKRVEKEVTVIKPLFLIDNGMEYKNVAIYSKECRGAMSRFIITSRLSSPEEMRAFSIDNFLYMDNLGDYNHPHFVRIG